MYDCLPPRYTAVLKVIASISRTGYSADVALVESVTKRLVKNFGTQTSVENICEELADLHVLKTSYGDDAAHECGFLNPALRDVVKVCAAPTPGPRGALEGEAPQSRGFVYQNLIHEGGGGIRQLLGAADTQIAHPATFSTAPAHQRRGSANAETRPAGAPAAAADRTQRPDATCEGKNG